MKLDVKIFEPDIWPLAVQGPKAEDVVVSVFGEDARKTKFFRFNSLEFQGHSFLVARSGWSAQGGFEIYVDDAVLGVQLYDALAQAGKQFDIGPGCPNLIERIEAGLMTYGSDITRADTPLQAAMEQYVSLDADIEAIGLDAIRAIDYTAIGTQVMVQTPAGEYGAEVSPVPFTGATKK